jgi:hypothetical protein
MFLALIIGAAMTGCLFSPDPAEDPPPQPPPEYLPPTSPENVLENFMLSHRELNSPEYRETTDTTFVFLPAPGDTVPYDFLTKAEDDEIMEDLFDQVESFEIDLIHSGAEPSDRQDFPASDGFMQIPTIALLRVTTREGDAGDPLILLVNNQPATFIFGPDSTETPVTWKIVLHQDQSTIGRVGHQIARVN